MDAVTEVLIDRSHQADRLSQMVIVSLVAHAILGAARTDASNFCCPEYLTTMQRLVYANWKPNQGQAGTNVVKFVVHRDGGISDITVETGAGQFLDLASQRALEQTQRLPPLPQAY